MVLQISRVPSETLKSSRRVNMMSRPTCVQQEVLGTIHFYHLGSSFLVKRYLGKTKTVCFYRCLVKLVQRGLDSGKPKCGNTICPSSPTASLRSQVTVTVSGPYHERTVVVMCVSKKLHSAIDLSAHNRSDGDDQQIESSGDFASDARE